MDQAQKDDCCEHLAHGNSLVSWCKLSGVSYTKVMVTLRCDLEFQQNYAHAREVAADFLVDEIITISDDVSRDVTKDAQGNYVVDGFGAQRARLMVDSRKWVAGKMKPKKYGESSQVKLSGDPDAPLTPPIVQIQLIPSNASQDS